MVKNKDTLRRIIVFLLWWAVNSFTLLIVSQISPTQFALGNLALSIEVAAVLTGLILALVVTLIEPLFTVLHIHVKHDMTWALVYWFVNVEAIWIMARFAEYTGLGIASFWVAVVVGGIVNLVQWGVWRVGQKLTL